MKKPQHIQSHSRRLLPFRFSSLLLGVGLFIALWINVPAGIPVKFSVGGFSVDRKTQPLIIDATIFGKPIKKEFVTKLGLDLQGGSHLLYEADVSKIPAKDREDALASARDIIERRVNFFGVSEPLVQSLRAGSAYRISVDLPGLDNSQDAISRIGTTAQLEFREKIPASQEAQLKKMRAEQPVASDSAAQQQQDFFDFVLSFKSTGLTGAEVKKASVQFSAGQATDVGPSILLEFNQKGADLFEKVTGRNVGKPLGIFVDGYPITNPPIVQTKITDGNAVISGQFTVDEAKALAVQINSGALPIPVKLIEQRTIGPSLGQESIEKSMVAGIVGLTSVIVFMILYYRGMGVIAGIGLAMYALISLAIFRAIPIVLTLPGVAGFILSVGMAVDSNILIFERIKEEERKGKRFDVALNSGFGKAMDAIKDANIATIMVGLILFNPLNWEFFPQFGLIRGFAVTLIIGVVTSLFTGIVITRRLMNTFYARKIRALQTQQRNI